MSDLADWTARDVVRHLVEWFPGFLSAGGMELPPGPSVDDDPVDAWRTHADGVQALLDAPDADQPFTHPRAGAHPLNEAIDMFWASDASVQDRMLGFIGRDLYWKPDA